MKQLGSFDKLVAAQSAAHKAGYVAFSGYGESGDYGPKSREYWLKPSTGAQATISYVAGQWRVTAFEVGA